MRSPNAGSVRMRTPKKLMSIVAWPIQQSVMALSGHAFGSGRTGAGRTARRASASSTRIQRAARRFEVLSQ